MTTFKALGQKVREPRKELETFPAPEGVAEVTLRCHEFTSLCPVTGQPDFGVVTIIYRPRTLCLESKSLKLYLWTFRERGHFCEALSSEIAKDLLAVLGCRSIEVRVEQTSRGGIEVTSHAFLQSEKEAVPSLF